MPTRVLIVDDSPLIRQVLSDMLGNEPGIEVIGTACDGEEALEKVENLKPDVVTLDVEMPKMDGLNCLDRIMKQFPLPVIIVSYLSLKGAEVTLRCLELGAVDFVTKPSIKNDDIDTMDSIKQELIQKVRIAAGIQLFKLRDYLATADLSQIIRQKVALNVNLKLDLELMAIGSSTGGPKALYYLLAQLPKNFPLGIIIAQHMPKDFTNLFAKRLNEYCNLEVVEAKTGDKVSPGKVLIAPSGFQTKILRSGRALVVEVSEEPKLILRPSVDYLFNSIAECCQGKVLGILLTGMGTDGALGMKHLKDLGARTIAQDEKSCIVYGMPKAAVEMGGVEFVEGLTNIYNRIISIINQ